MTFFRRLQRRTVLASLLLAFSALSAQAAEIRVITSGAFTEAYKTLVPLFEAASGHKVISSFGASIGNAPDSIPSRFARGEKFDLVILSEGGLEALNKEGKCQRHLPLD
jgi:molybdate transport system substrate-binding protein